jgi:hypothetical protein
LKPQLICDSTKLLTFIRGHPLPEECVCSARGQGSEVLTNMIGECDAGDRGRARWWWTRLNWSLLLLLTVELGQLLDLGRVKRHVGGLGVGQCRRDCWGQTGTTRARGIEH